MCSLAELKQAAGDVVAAARRYRPEARLHGVLVSEMAQGVEVDVNPLMVTVSGMVAADALVVLRD